MASECSGSVRSFLVTGVLLHRIGVPPCRSCRRLRSFALFSGRHRAQAFADHIQHIATVTQWNGAKHGEVAEDD